MFSVTANTLMEPFVILRGRTGEKSDVDYGDDNEKVNVAQSQEKECGGNDWNAAHEYLLKTKKDLYFRYFFQLDKIIKKVDYFTSCGRFE